MLNSTYAFNAAVTATEKLTTACTALGDAMTAIEQALNEANWHHGHSDGARGEREADLLDWAKKIALPAQQMAALALEHLASAAVTIHQSEDYEDPRISAVEWERGS